MTYDEFVAAVAVFMPTAWCEEVTRYGEARSEVVIYTGLWADADGDLTTEDEATEKAHLTAHEVRIYREKKWPAQWIGSCACGRGIRCNDEATAAAFFMEEGCQ